MATLQAELKGALRESVDLCRTLSEQIAALKRLAETDGDESG